MIMITPVLFINKIMWKCVCVCVCVGGGGGGGGDTILSRCNTLTICKAINNSVMYICYVSIR